MSECLSVNIERDVPHVQQKTFHNVGTTLETNINDVHMSDDFSVDHL